MVNDPNTYLMALDDGLIMRESQSYAQDKLYALEAYLKMACMSMKNKGWFSFNYIDLQAGPGKNRIEDEIYLGSPLIALSTNPPFTHYWFNELNPSEYGALRARTDQSPLKSQIHLTSQDVNTAVDSVAENIIEMDKEARAQRKWSTFNIAFLDPEGLEMKWATVEKLARINRMDLIINFSTVGINRNLHQPEVLNEYFGSEDWQKVMSSTDPIHRRRHLINLYRQQLERHSYHIVIDDDLGHHDISMRNRKNAEVYSLIFASKHPLGDKFWRQVKDEIEKIRHRSKRLL